MELDRMSAQIYFVVWCEDGNSPTVKHTFYTSARIEAQRLARANPGHRFTVLASVMGFETMAITETVYLGMDRSLDDEIPF